MSLLRKKNLRMRDFQWLDLGAGWGEANIWCTWFRIAAAQKCFNALFPENKVSSGFYQALVLEVTTPRSRLWSQISRLRTFSGVTTSLNGS